MPKLRVCGFSLSVDGYGAGPHQDTANPLGLGGTALHEWAFGTRTFQKMFGGEGGSAGVDDQFAMRGFENIGAWIMGRNMFGPVRGPWPDETWKGWWGSNPPYHTPVFVLTHYERDPVVMEGGTTFHFVQDGIEAALRHAKDAANGRDVRGWRRRYNPAVPSSRANRRDAHRHLAGSAGRRGEPFRRHRRKKARLSMHRAGRDDESHAHDDFARGVGLLCFGRGSLATDRGGEVRGASRLRGAARPRTRTSEPRDRTGEVAEATGEGDPSGL